MKFELTKKFTAIFCLIIICFSCLFSCATNDNGNGENNGDTPPEQTTPTPPVEYDNVYYGSYPQSAVTDESVKDTLLSLVGNLPIENNLNGWTDYEYYILEQKETYAFYKDITLEGTKYRAVYFTKYRPYSSKLASTELYSFQDDNGYFVNTIYFFKFEPLCWRVLEDKDGEKLLLLENVIDARAFQPDYYLSPVNGINVKSDFYYTTANDAPDGTFANSYEYSGVRKYLKDNFYKDAFTSREKSNIVLSTVKNDANSAGQSFNEFSSRDTEDYVYIPSFMEIKNSDYGFKNQGEEDTLRKQPYTDYAKCQGAYCDAQSEYKWWLRSSAQDYINKYSNRAQAVGNSGKVYNNHYAEYTIMGVVPMMKIYAE